MESLKRMPYGKQCTRIVTLLQKLRCKDTSTETIELKLFKRIKPENCSDAELIAYYKQSGDTHYAGVLYTRYTRLIAALAYQYLKDEADIEDASMDVFEILVRDLKAHDVKNFKAWLYSVTKNHCLKKKRQLVREREQKEQILYEDAPVLGQHAERDRELALLKNQRIDSIEESMENLSPEQKLCVELFYLKQMSYQEVATATGYTIKQVKSYIQNGKRNLKIEMQQKMP